MKSNYLGKLTLIAAATAIGAISSAQAATLTTTKYWSLSDSYSSGTNVTSGVYDYFDDVDQLLFDQFDTSLGTLDSVSISYTSSKVGTYASAGFRDDDWANETAGLQRVYASFSSSISGLGGLGTSGVRSTRTDTCAGSVSLTSGSSCSTYLGTSYASSPSTYYNNLTSSSVLDAFTGSGVIVALFDLYGWIYTNETDGDDGYINTRSGSAAANGYMTVTYNYTVPPAPVPVPAAAWLFGSALFGLATVGRKRALISA